MSEKSEKPAKPAIPESLKPAIPEPLKPVVPEVLQPLDLSNVKIRYRNWNDAELVLPYDSYTAEGNKLGTDLFRETAMAAGTRSPQPANLEVYPYGKDLAGAPTDGASNTTLELRWVKGGTRVRVDLTRYLMSHPFAIPANTKAHIPLIAKQIPGAGANGHAIVIQFSEATFEAIEERTKPETEAAAALQPDNPANKKSST